MGSWMPPALAEMPESDQVEHLAVPEGCEAVHAPMTASVFQRGRRAGPARARGAEAGGAGCDEDRIGDCGAPVGRRGARSAVQSRADGKRRPATGNPSFELSGLIADQRHSEKDIEPLDITAFESAYRAGTLTPTAVVERVYDEIERARASGRSGSRWLRKKKISLAPRDSKSIRGARALPLLRDSIRGQGQLRRRRPAHHRCLSRVCARCDANGDGGARLLDAGAILIGKTNMDQFATGLVGTRTPYGICSSVFDSKYISGGSSSGSAVAVASGLVSFSLGTDTAGSGRVPAAFNNLVGLKPTRGLLSTHGLLPACRTLDCVSIFAETCADAARVFAVARGFDAADPTPACPCRARGAAPWSASADFRFGVPPRVLEFFGDAAASTFYRRRFRSADALGGTAVEFDYEPFAKRRACSTKARGSPNGWLRSRSFSPTIRDARSNGGRDHSRRSNSVPWTHSKRPTRWKHCGAKPPRFGSRRTFCCCPLRQRITPSSRCRPRPLS